MREKVLGEVRKMFRPEFLNRVDEIIVFHELGAEQLRHIVDLMAKEVEERLEDMAIGLEITEAAKGWLAKVGYDPVYGARPLKRFIQRELETKLGRSIIAGDIVDGTQVRVDVKNDELVFNAESAGPEKVRSRTAG
jgi:ATP-dependent Clp protease ATP-binding subunit ClpA